MRSIPQITEIREHANAIIKAHDGKTYFNIREVHKITGYSLGTIPRMFSDQGILVKKDGKSKKVSAFDIAELMVSNRQSAVC